MKQPKLSIFCDFDGTMTVGDVVDTLLEKLADPKWREVEQEWEMGRIGSRDCMQRQTELIRGGWSAMEKALKDVSLEPSLKPFVSWCLDQGIQFNVVSEGYDRVIEYLLRREEITVTRTWANKLVELPGGCFRLDCLPRDGCRSGVCKCEAMDSIEKSGPLVLIGDGRSDYCCAFAADIIFAKGKLLEHCRRNSLPVISYRDFTQIEDYLVRERSIARLDYSIVRAEEGKNRWLQHERN